MDESIKLYGVLIFNSSPIISTLPLIKSISDFLFDKWSKYIDGLALGIFKPKFLTYSIGASNERGIFFFVAISKASSAHPEATFQ